ncbi:MAG: GNAT family N-acetyltransferase [Candidatus Bathyarchaeota archaeon]|nr:GNAT family N-acetyltransferase [Candidatus Bathyarchaeota archaeon]
MVAIVLILDGEGVYLRPLQESDGETFPAWLSDGQVTRFLGMQPLTRRRAKALFDQLLNDPNGVYFGIIKKPENRMICYVFLAHILKSHKVAREFGVITGNKEFWGQGYGIEATRLMLEYGFKTLGLHRIQLIVLDFNERALRMYRKIGFVVEGFQREARLVDGKWHNVIMMSMLDHEFAKNRELT